MPAPTEIEFCGVRLNNPVVMASGILGVGRELLLRAARGGAGAVTPKSCSLEPRAGHANPTVIDYGWGLTNAVGLSNLGVDAEVEELGGIQNELRPLGVPFIASMFDGTVERFGRTAERLETLEPDMIEVNISCPNTESDLGRMFAADRAAAGAVIREIVSRTSTPILAKLSPNVTDIKEIAIACQEAGAAALACVNTFGPGMVIDVETGVPILANKVGGISGPSMKPLAVAKVYEVAEAVDIPVIGMGGVTSGEDVAEMIMAGATAVGVGSAAYYRPEGPEVFGAIAREFAEFMESHHHPSIESIRGIAHDNARKPAFYAT